MEQLSEDLRRIVARAGRVIRLAKLRAPAVIIVQTEDTLRAAVDRHARAVGSDPDGLRAMMVAAQLSAETLTQEDEAELREMDAEMAAYEAAEPKAKAKWLAEFFHPDAAAQATGAKLWLALDHSYRSDLVFEEMQNARAS